MSCCNSLPEKCGEKEGDCDSDDHCKAGHACGTDNCPADGNFPPEADCCYNVTGITITSSVRPISFFSYRPIPIKPDKLNFLIGRYR